ncbi:MAG: 6-phospho-alpha-glucosidase, partial [Tetragenococcus koreensis]|nr:6-phospho-alpha-glucosidase [Tetragenococcus koreensis]
MKTNHLNVVIAGGGSTYTPGIVQAMISSRERFPFSSLTLYDIDEARNDDMFEIIRYMLKKEALSNEVDLYQTTDAQEAFTGADFIFSQLRVGGMKMRELDEKIPMKYGLVGQETCGLGGFSYGLRSIKGLLEIVSYVDHYASDAWLLNYTNPETLVSEAVRRAFPDVKMLNACDMTISIEETI